MKKRLIPILLVLLLAAVLLTGCGQADTDGGKSGTEEDTAAKDCDHRYGSWEKADDETHKRICSDCGKEEISAHAWDGGTVSTEPTHLAEGVKTFTCSDCGATRTETVSKLSDHTYGDWQKCDATRHERTCACGDTQYEDHAWGPGEITAQPTCKDAGVKTFTCTVCGETRTEEIPVTGDHSFGSWAKLDDNIHTHTCSVCGKEETSAHAWDDGTITAEPTHLAGGVRLFTCPDCGATRTESFALAGHAHFDDPYSCFISDEYLKATDGTVKTYYKSCMICGEKSEETFTVDTAKSYRIVGEYEEKSVQEIMNEYLPAGTNPAYLGIVLGKIEELIGDGLVTFRRYAYEYVSEFDGERDIVISGAVTIPFNDGQPVINGVDIDHHPTLRDASEAPSKGFDIYGIPMITGLSCVEPDLIGFGSTVNLPADYHCRHASDINSFDALRAAYDLIRDEIGVDCSGMKLFNTGYSQGGYNALSFMRFFEEEVSAEDKEKFNLVYTLAGSGAYDLNLMISDSLNNDDFQYPEYILMGIMTAKYYHPELFKDLEVDDFLTDLGKEYVKPIINKDDAALQALKRRTDETGEPLYKTPRDFFSDAFFHAEGGLKEILDAYCDGENLLDNEWTPAGNLSLFYTLSDELVSPNCSEKAIDLWGSLPNVAYTSSAFDTHQGYGTQYYLLSLVKLSGELS